MDNSLFIVAILWGVIGFAAYYFLAHRESYTGRVSEVVAQRAWGVLFMGMVTLMLVLLIWKEKPGSFGLGFSFLAPPPWWSYLAIPVIIIASHFQASSPGNLAQYPQIRIDNWSRRVVALSAGSWIAFLVAYEFFFRGFILFASLNVLEPWPAIALNCSLYGFAHFYKGPGETFGAVAVGLLLCYLTIHTGNIWSAVILHSVMALSNEWFSLRSHPEMKLLRN
ncbi:MAG: CPBP family intramembrane metalloprotease [Bacteroidetes bacterium]|nr:CPBP family intramembrane metalloprotease [Bacteroidota bacterium]